MMKIDDKPFVAFDLDDTLLYWHHVPGRRQIKVPMNGREETYDVHEKNLEALKKHKGRNHTIMIWSAGGVEWIEAAIKALQLEEYVDIIMPKPTWIYDDLEPNKFLPNNLYIHEEADDPT